jgi:hypothetical protein
MLPFSKGLMDTLAAPHASTHTVELSRPAQAPGSMHAPLTEEVETLLLGGMQDLRVDAVEKQRELEEQLVAVAARRDAALQRLTGTITPQREARLIRQRVALEVALGSLDAELSQAVSSAFQRHDEVLAAPAERLERLGGVEEDFYFHQVPMLFEAQCRASVDTMEGERQALQLNNATVSGGSQCVAAAGSAQGECALASAALSRHSSLAPHTHTRTHARSTPGSRPSLSAWTATSRATAAEQQQSRRSALPSTPASMPPSLCSLRAWRTLRALLRSATLRSCSQWLLPAQQRPRRAQLQTQSWLPPCTPRWRA